MVEAGAGSANGGGCFAVSPGRVTVVLGAQWGDEGKGKVSDFLAQHADIVCRCQVTPSFVTYARQNLTCRKDVSRFGPLFSIDSEFGPFPHKLRIKVATFDRFRVFAMCMYNITWTIERGVVCSILFFYVRYQFLYS